MSRANMQTRAGVSREGTMAGSMDAWAPWAEPTAGNAPALRPRVKSQNPGVWVSVRRLLTRLGLFLGTSSDMSKIVKAVSLTMFCWHVG